MWMLTEAEAVEMFARHLVARHRAGASPRAREKAEFLKRQGDAKGHQIWNAVADKIENSQNEKRRGSH